MVEIVIGIILLIIILALAKVFKFNLKEIKEVAEKQYDDKTILEEIEKLPPNTEICKEILKELNNEQVEVIENKEYNSSLYTVYNNRITIGNIKNKIYTVQTIAHECIHSIQDKRKSTFNFVISNIYMLYYYFIIIGTIISKIFNIKNPIIENTMLNIVLLLILALCQYAIRSMLETEAILESKHLAKKYFQKQGIKKEIIDRIIKEYSETNAMGLNVINYMLIAKSMIKVLIYIALITITKII